MFERLKHAASIVRFWRNFAEHVQFCRSKKGVIRTFFPYLHYINKSLNIQDGQRYRLLKTESCS